MVEIQPPLNEKSGVPAAPWVSEGQFADDLFRAGPWTPGLDKATFLEPRTPRAHFWHCPSRPFAERARRRRRRLKKAAALLPEHLF